MSKFDSKIEELLEKVEEQKKNLGSKPKVSWNTNGLFKYDSNRFFNLNAVTDSQVLVEAFAFLLKEQTTFEEASKRLGVPLKSEFDWSGFSLSDWENDFKLRIEVLNWLERHRELKVTEAKLNSLVSEEAKTMKELNELEKLLS